MDSFFIGFFTASLILAIPLLIFGVPYFKLFFAERKLKRIVDDLGKHVSTILDEETQELLKKANELIEKNGN